MQSYPFPSYGGYYTESRSREAVTRIELVDAGEAVRLPMSAKEARAQCNLDHQDDDALLLGYIRSATIEAERTMNRDLIARNYRFYLDRFYSRIELPRCKLLAVTSVKYDDADAVETTLDPTHYEVAFNGDYPGWIQLAPGQVWPELNPDKRLDRVRIEFRAGYGDNLHDIPGDILAGLRERIGTMYQVREDIVIGSSVEEVPGNAGRAYARNQVVEFG